jgi:23S rRNA (uracil1939-C5)-methyltransferase
VGRGRKKLPDTPFEVEIIGLGDGGLGLVEHDGRRLRVYDALPGERVRARYLFGRAFRGKVETLEVLDASPDRVAPRCPHFGVCSACSLQHASVDAQLRHKQAALLARLGDAGVTPGAVYAPLVGEAWNYRRKARLSVRLVPAKGRVLVGFRERNGKFVADMQECHVLRGEIGNALRELAQLLGSLDCRGDIPQLEVACGDGCCALVLRHLVELSASDRLRLTEFEERTGIRFYLQSAGPDSVRPLLPGGAPLEYAANGLRFQFEPLDFVQVNGALNREMIARALELLDPQPGEQVLDLFCGLGNFSLPLATRAAGVIALEGSQAMVERGRDNAALNGLQNVEFRCADLYEATAEGSPWGGAEFDKVLLDPPRTGAPELLPWIEKSGARKVLYVSCNPDTLACDAGVLAGELGFRLAGAGVMDMFPHTPHSEAIALFVRGEGPGP